MGVLVLAREMPLRGIAAALHCAQSSLPWQATVLTVCRRLPPRPCPSWQPGVPISLSRPGRRPPTLQDLTPHTQLAVMATLLASLRKVWQGLGFWGWGVASCNSRHRLLCTAAYVLILYASPCSLLGCAACPPHQQHKTAVFGHCG